MFFDPDFPDQKSLRAFVERHGQVLFQLFDQEGLRVDSLHLEVDLNAAFRMEPDNLKVMIDQFVRKGLIIPDISCSHASPLVIVHKNKGGIRIAVDYREVNQFLRVSANLLPYQDMIV